MRNLLLPLSVLTLLGTQACAVASGDSAEQTQAELSRPASAATTIVACTDTEDSTIDATLTVDASYRFTWQIGKMTPVASTLTKVTKHHNADYTSYRFGLATGEFVSLFLGADTTQITVGARQVSCSPKTVVRQERLAPALAANVWSLVRKHTFATCTFPDGGGQSIPVDDSFTVRPSLDGNGAIFEYASASDAFVLLARQLTPSADHLGTTYKGEGGVSLFDPEVTPLTELTFSGSPVIAQWDWQEAMPSNECNVTGADYAASLFR